ncbi:transglycosylase [Serratia sp. M24T3]|uniref:transglycosylase n=1 Tax=Serratia sp. M24T3 TaxID=932213 RepID=UPI001ED8CBC9|nr:transglycosylase [Serratia sp. M24T3]
MIEYTNISITIASVVSSKLATLYECQTVYCLEDVYDLLEIASVDNHNTKILSGGD